MVYTLRVLCTFIITDMALCNCSSSHIHHHHNVSSTQNKKWLSSTGDIPSPKAVNNLFAAAQFDHSRDLPRPSRAPPPSSEQPPIQYEIPLPLTEQEERKVAELLAASPVRKVRFASELELKPMKASRHYDKGSLLSADLFVSTDYEGT